jgi:hypothetical protein
MSIPKERRNNNSYSYNKNLSNGEMSIYYWTFLTLLRWKNCIIGCFRLIWSIFGYLIELDTIIALDPVDDQPGERLQLPTNEY